MKSINKFKCSKRTENVAAPDRQCLPFHSKHHWCDFFVTLWKITQNFYSIVLVFPGYSRIVLAIISFYFMPTNYIIASACYIISVLLDALDGHAARAFNQCEFFIVCNLIAFRTVNPSARRSVGREEGKRKIDKVHVVMSAVMGEIDCCFPWLLLIIMCVLILGTKFGAMLDQLTDRCGTMGLLVTLSYFYPKYMFWFQLSMSIDVACHWFYLHT